MTVMKDVTVLVTIGAWRLKVVVPEQVTVVEELDGWAVVVFWVTVNMERIVIEPDAFVPGPDLEVVDVEFGYGAPARCHISLQALPNRGQPYHPQTRLPPSTPPAGRQRQLASPTA